MENFHLTLQIYVQKGSNQFFSFLLTCSLTHSFVLCLAYTPSVGRIFETQYSSLFIADGMVFFSTRVCVFLHECEILNCGISLNLLKQKEKRSKVSRDFIELLKNNSM
jgi:hypothetical protein